MLNRVQQENVTLRENFENRLRSLENRWFWILGIGAVIVFEIPIAIYFLK